MLSIYKGQLLWPVAAPLVVRMQSYKRGVAIVQIFPYPAVDLHDKKSN